MTKLPNFKFAIFKSAVFWPKVPNLMTATYSRYTVYGVPIHKRFSMMYTCIMPLTFIGLNTLLHTGSDVVAVPSTQLHAQQTAGCTPSVQAPVYPNSEGEYGLLSPCIFSLSIKGRM